MSSISIIVPVFNGIRYLPSFLLSLAEAVPPDTEIIFVDDGSSEPVLEVIPDSLSTSPVTKLQNSQNLGYSVAVNRGFRQATGDIVVQLNTDLVLHRECINAMIEFIEATPRVGIVGSKQLHPTTGLVRHIGMAFGQARHRHVYSGLPADHALCCKTRPMQMTSGATAAMTRQVLEDIGPLDERYYNTLENFDHCLRARAQGYQNFTCADSITYHWVGQSGPARFARVDEDEALFWADWSVSRSVDLDRFVDEALDHLLSEHPQLLSYDLEPLALCRSVDESLLLQCLEGRWPGIRSRKHSTGVKNSPKEQLWLPMELPHRAMVSPSPYVYLVDRVSQLSENRMWFEARERIVETEIVMDVRAAAMTTDELPQLHYRAHQ